MDSMEGFFHSIANQIYIIHKEINDNIKLLHKMMDEGNGEKEERSIKRDKDTEGKENT